MVNPKRLQAYHLLSSALTCFYDHRTLKNNTGDSGQTGRNCANAWLHFTKKEYSSAVISVKLSF